MPPHDSSGKTQVQDIHCLNALEEISFVFVFHIFQGNLCQQIHILWGGSEKKQVMIKYLTSGKSVTSMSWPSFENQEGHFLFSLKHHAQLSDSVNLELLTRREETASQ